MDGAIKEMSENGEMSAEGARILVVDDSDALRRHVRDILEHSSLRAQVTEARDGATGARMALNTDVDCVLCDLQMPILDGMGFLRLVRARHTRLELPVLLLTASDAVADKLSGFKGGASDFINKPCDPGELVARAEAHVILARMHRHLAAQADRDPLTGALNRRSLARAFTKESARVARTGGALGLLLLDIDHFKHINDAHGHPTGDAVLRDLGALMRAHLRPYDVIARMGGEEFATLLPATDATQTVGAAERLRARVEASALGGLPVGAVKVSVGALASQAPQVDGFEALYKRADEFLYAAKQGGRNRVVSAAPTGTHAVAA